MSETFRIDRAKVAAREVGGELVILNLNSHHYLGGNSAAAVLWPLLERGATRDEFVDRLISKFGLTKERAEADVNAFLQSLGEFGVLEA